jgi:hypothetical protein
MDEFGAARHTPLRPMRMHVFTDVVVTCVTRASHHVMGTVVRAAEIACDIIPIDALLVTELPPPSQPTLGTERSNSAHHHGAGVQLRWGRERVCLLFADREKQLALLDTVATLMQRRGLL